MRKLLGPTGEQLIEIVQVHNPGFSVERLLTEHVGLDELDALEIDSSTRSARVFPVADGAISSSTSFDADQTESGHHSNLAVRNINEIFFGERIVVNGVMAQVFSSVVESDNLLNPDHQQAVEVGVKAASIFEMGHFIGQKVFEKL